MNTETEATEKLLGCYQALKMVHAGYELASSQLSQVLGVPLCVPGCGLCCQVNVVYAYGVEAAFAVSNLATDKKLGEVINRAKDWLLENDKDAPTHVPVVGGEPIVLTKGLSGEIDLLAGKGCPFLNSEKNCVIHTYRPLVCRAFGVTRIAHKDCRRPIGKAEVYGKVAYFGGLGSTAIKDVLEEILREVPTSIGAQSGFFPTLLFAIAQPAEYRKLALSGKVSTAKLLLFDNFHGLLWQDQLERYREVVAQTNGGAV
jgi:Fe-S-cluster containining protein